MSSHQHVRFFSLVFVLLTGIILGFFIFRPFIAELFLALVLVVVAQPLHKSVMHTISHKALSAGITTLLVLLLIIVPASIVGTLLVKETVSFAGSFTTTDTSVADLVIRVDDALAHAIPYYHQGTISPTSSAVYIEQVLKWFVNNIQGIFSNVLEWIVSTAIVLLALYYLFKDGDQLYAYALDTSPLDDDLDRRIGREIASIIQAVISGRVIVGIVQGVATYVGFIFFGISNPLILSAVVSIIAILPLLGPMIIILPIVLYQFVLGHMFVAIGLLLWGLFVVGLIDNFLGPILIHSKTRIHPFIVLIAILGGFHIFGPIGFVAGPVVVGIVAVLFRILPLVYAELYTSRKRPVRTRVVRKA